MSGLSVFDPTLTLGVMEIGILISCILFGVVSVQTSTYYQRSRSFHDTSLLKALVGLVWCLELAHTGCIFHALYDSTILKYGAPEKLGQFYSVNASLFFTGCTAFTVQTLFAFRVRRLTRRGHFWAIILFITCLCFVGVLYAVIQGFILGSHLEKAREQLGWVFTSSLVLSAAVDLAISVAMCWSLGKRRVKSFPGMASVLGRLIRWTIQTGVLTSLTAVAMLICFQIMPHNFVWLALHTCRAKMYSNSMLSSLNARTKLRRDLNKRGNDFISNPISIEMSKTVEITGMSDMRMAPNPALSTDSDDNLENDVFDDKRLHDARGFGRDGGEEDGASGKNEVLAV